MRRQRFIAAGESNNDAIIAKDSNQRSVGLCLAAASCEAILSEMRGVVRQTDARLERFSLSTNACNRHYISRSSTLTILILSNE